MAAWLPLLFDPLVYAGHYGVVRIGTDKATGEKVAIKTVPKRRAVYIEMLRLEVEILRVRSSSRFSHDCFKTRVPFTESIAR